MAQNLNPQKAHMADESMVRNLSAQAEAIWPQELPILRRHPLPAAPRILDAGCGTGEASWRLAEAFPAATLLGVDVLDTSLGRAREKAARFGDRVRFENRSIFELGLPPASFDLVVCRHVLQSIPHAERAIAELARVARPGGTVHLVVWLPADEEPLEERTIALARWCAGFLAGLGCGWQLATLSVEARRRAHSGPLGVGCTASRAVGGAVQRNRARRRLREIVRRRWARVPPQGYLLVFIASRRTLEAPHQLLATDVETLLAHAGALAPLPV